MNNFKQNFQYISSMTYRLCQKNKLKINKIELKNFKKITTSQKLLNQKTMKKFNN